MRTLCVNATNFRARRTRFCLLILVLLPLFSAACGKHKVKAKAPTPVSSVPIKKAESAKPAIPQTKSEPGKQTGAPEAVVLEPAASEPAAALAGNAPGPLIRIGLTTSARELRISCPGEFYVLEKVPEAERQLIQGDVQLRVEQEIREASLRLGQQGQPYRPRRGWRLVHRS